MKKIFIIAGIIVLGFASYRKKGYLENEYIKIKWTIFKSVSQYLQKPDFEIIAEDVFPSLKFNEPISLKFFKIKDKETLFVLERGGELKKIDLIHNEAFTILNLKNIVSQDLLKGAIDFTFSVTKNTSLLFLTYSKKVKKINHLIVSSFPVSDFNKNIQLSSENIILDIESKDHQGGTVEFGKDGFLYISIGDGEDTDPKNNAQDLSKLNGKILRIDIQNKENLGYSIPTDNPYFGNKKGYREEIYAFGFRNPFRFSIDEVNNKLWVGDVGQENFEEINIVRKGGNYGWKIMEGDSCLNSQSGSQNQILQGPIYSYKHGIEGFSITGGQIYMGNKIPYLKGKYIYGDYVRGVIWALEFENQKSVQNELIGQNIGNVTAFDSDASNELYFCDMIGGKIKKIVPKKENINE
ncbi:PQQ-dependent sugar dehydrogenase [Lacihabitans soyangensis]|uniref:Glucose sorbosone dehydrogenase n=1 Tax=Lacihabitans soyangensis TaxID=869394 RepID=A0AAE3KV81_9BACT|nr:PQQ-dependent sugar dehydrogenase [Lacihabitans soyangensis]MCP9765803.1 glucose sorbosone dehydrogenase [Lacihabitans soyangensis]